MLVFDYLSLNLNVMDKNHFKYLMTAPKLDITREELTAKVSAIVYEYGNLS